MFEKARVCELHIYLKQDISVSQRKVRFETLISDLNYTNDTGQVADCWYDMKAILESLELCQCFDMGLTINTKKTSYPCTSTH